MRKSLFIALCVVTAFLCSCSIPFSNRGTVDSPYVGASNQSTLSIERVDLSDSATVLHSVVHYIPGNWIRISDSSVIVAGGEKYRLQSIDGIPVGETVWMPDSGVIRFSMKFPAIPSDARSLDFSECIANGWNLWDVDLTGKASYPAFVLESFLRKKGKSRN